MMWLFAAGVFQLVAVGALVLCTLAVAGACVWPMNYFAASDAPPPTSSPPPSPVPTVVVTVTCACPCSQGKYFPPTRRKIPKPTLLRTSYHCAERRLEVAMVMPSGKPLNSEC